MTSRAILCELCDGTGWVEQTPGAPGHRMTRCPCWLNNLPTFADGVPLEFREARLANYREMPGNQAAVRVAKAWLRDRQDLLLVGRVGSGKTRLVTSLLNEHFVEHRTGRFCRVASVLDQLRLSFDSPEAELQARERMASVPLLVLDDLGLEKPSDFTNRELVKLYDARSDCGVVTIWTSNLALSCGKSRPNDPDRPPTLGEFLGDDRLPSRLAGRAEVVHLDVADQRLVGRGRTQGARG